MTLLHGARSGDLASVAAAPPTSSRTCANADCIVIQGSNMAEAHPVGFQWVMEAKARGAHGHPRRPALHPHQRGRRPLRADPRRDRHRVPRRPDQLRPEQRAGLPRVRRRLHERRRRSSREDFRRHRGPRRPVLRLRRATRHVRPRQLAVRGRGVRPTRTRGDTAEAQGADAARCSAGSGGAPLERRHGRRRRRTRRCSTRAASSRSSSGTSPATRRRWSSGSAASPPEQFLAVAEALDGELRPRADHGAGLRGRLDAAQRRRAVHPHRRDPAAAAGQHRPARAAASWRCAGTPASRAPPTSRRCTTCCPATCRCRSAQRHDDLDELPGRRPQPTRRRASGRRPTRTWCPCSRRTGASARRPENDFGFDYLPRITGDHGTYRTVMDMVDGGRSPATSCSGRTRRSARRTAGCSAWAWPTSTGWSSATSP